jgi:hypothetical protein
MTASTLLNGLQFALGINAAFILGAALLVAIFLHLPAPSKSHGQGSGAAEVSVIGRSPAHKSARMSTAQRSCARRDNNGEGEGGETTDRSGHGPAPVFDVRPTRLSRPRRTA